MSTIKILSIASAIIVPIAMLAGVFWWNGRDTHRWTLSVSNQRDSQTLVAGIHDGDGLTEGYSVVDPRTSEAAVVGHDGKPPDYIIIDFESHRGSDGKLIVVPAWQATKRALVCPWEEAQRYEPLIVTDDVSTCADLAGQ